MCNPHPDKQPEGKRTGRAGRAEGGETKGYCGVSGIIITKIRIVGDICIRVEIGGRKKSKFRHWTGHAEVLSCPTLLCERDSQRSRMRD
jgi:hypothetical protein